MGLFTSYLLVRGILKKAEEMTAYVKVKLYI